MKTLKRFILTTPVINTIFEYLNKVRITRSLIVRPLSQKEKADLIIKYANKYKSKVLIETGTYQGDTVARCLNHFDKIYSIELGQELYDYCAKRFENVDKVKIYQGNSADIIPQIVSDKPVLFWLDAHYSGGETADANGAPVVQELDFIFNNCKDSCILLDDARCFNGKAGYPKISLIKKWIDVENAKGSTWSLSVKNDIIRIVSK